jgi:hypothetical protein
LTLKELTWELAERGFHDVPQTRREAFVNRSYQRICGSQAWGFLETQAVGSSPLVVADVRAVLQVIDTTNNSVLTWADPRDVRDADPSLVETGLPTVWYLRDATITTWPTTSVSLLVRYIHAPNPLGASETPLTPTRFDNVIVEGAICEALKAKGDYQNASACEQMFQMGLIEMRNELLIEHFDVGASIGVTDHSTDW